MNKKTEWSKIAPKPGCQNRINESEDSHDVLTYTPYQVVHEKNRIVIVVDGERRQREGGFEHDTIEFLLVGDTITGRIMTDAYKVDGDMTWADLEHDSQRPFNLIRAKAELIEHQGKDQDYAEPFGLALVNKFKTGKSRVVTLEDHYIPTAPKLRITLS